MFPWHKGKIGVYSEETLEKMRQAKLGKKLSKEHRLNMGLARKGHTTSEETRRKIADSLRGRKRPQEVIEKLRIAGRNKSSEVRQKLRLAQLGKKLSIETRIKIGNSNKGHFVYNITRHRIKKAHLERKERLGYINSIETRRRISIGQMGRIPWNKGKEFIQILGDKHWNWMGGKSFEPYALGWNKTFKEQIRQRDNYKCQLCGVSETECIKTLSVHHIDYNKKNLDKNNLVSLCSKCHSQTNWNREYWIKYFGDKLCLVG